MHFLLGPLENTLGKSRRVGLLSTQLYKPELATGKKQKKNLKKSQSSNESEEAEEEEDDENFDGSYDDEEEDKPKHKK